MTTIQGDSLSLLDQFESFYNKLLSAKEDVLKKWPIPVSSSFPPTPNQQEAQNQKNSSSVTPFPIEEEGLGSEANTEIKKSFDDQISQVSSNLSSFLREQKTSVLTSFGQYAEQYYVEAQYIMAAYADEFFLNLEWRGQKVWDQCLIEMNLFNSHVAGDLFFERLEEFINVSASKSTIGLGILYYWILSLGFQGKYRGTPEAEENIKKYKDRLFLIITGHRSRINQKQYTLFPQAYKQMITEGESQKITSPKWWWGAVIILICCFVIISHLIWVDITSEANEAMNKILQLGLAKKGS